MLLWYGACILIVTRTVTYMLFGIGHRRVDVGCHYRRRQHSSVIVVHLCRVVCRPVVVGETNRPRNNDHVTTNLR